MELSQYVIDFSFSGRGHCFPWPSCLKSVETGPFFMSINGLFSSICGGMQAFLKGFMRIRLYIESEALDECCRVTFSIVLKTIRVAGVML